MGIGLRGRGVSGSQERTQAVGYTGDIEDLNE